MSKCDFGVLDNFRTGILTLLGAQKNYSFPENYEKISTLSLLNLYKELKHSLYNIIPDLERKCFKTLF